MPLVAGQRRRVSLAKPADVVRIAVLGGAQTGKTSLVRQFLEFKFPQKYRPTVDDIIQMSYKSDGATYDVEIIDATGSFEFPAMQRHYVDTSDAFIIVMSVDSAPSVEEAHRLLHLIRERRSSLTDFNKLNAHNALHSSLSIVRHNDNSKPAPRIVFVLNKMDLPEKERQVDASHIQDDHDFGYENVVLSSAKKNWNVDEAFSRLVVHREVASASDENQMDKSLEAALQHRRVTAPSIDLTGASDSFLLAVKNTFSNNRPDSNYSPIAP